MSPSSHSHHRSNGSQSDSSTVAAFSPTTISGSSLTSKRRSSVIVHRRSPLLVATPPEITRTLAYSHPFILPLNTLVGLLTWTTGDPWQSFLFLAGFWTIVLYSDAVILWAGPVVVVVSLILALYTRRYSPLTSVSSLGEQPGVQKGVPENITATRHHKSLDEIVDTMRTFTTRCNILMEPILELTDFLSTQMTPPSPTTRPPLSGLIIRIILATPIWILLTLPPFYLVTTRRVVMSTGTIILSYHSRPARVARVILWRSLTIRRICTLITGLSFSTTVFESRAPKSPVNILSKQRGHTPGIRFTFVLYENQRRWLGVGWTYSLFPSECAAWTDEMFNPAPSKDEFELPEVGNENTKWQWVEGSEWRVEPSGESDDKSTDGEGWVYFDNKWNDGRPGQDGWDRYTRRRKWFRVAELVDTTPNSETGSLKAPPSLAHVLREKDVDSTHLDAANISGTKSPTPSISSKPRKRHWFSSSKGESDKINVSSLPSSAKNSSVDLPRINPTNASESKSGQKPPKPGSIKQSSRPPSNSAKASHSSLMKEGSTHGSDTLSIRDKEISQAQDHHDRWGTRATGGTERAEREFGLGDDVNMGLS